MTTPSTARLLESLDADFRRLHDLADRAGSDDLAAKVPTCPEWTVADLVDHVATVYAHKAETMRLGEFPDDWPPERGPEAPAAYLRRAYAALADEFAARAPEERATTWFGPDQTVGFWIRRMVHESVIHRVDGELGLGADRAAIPHDIAVDGIDEVLSTFLAYASQEWPDDFEGALPSNGETALVRAGETGWLITFGDRVTVVPADSAAGILGAPGGDQGAISSGQRRMADVTLTGDPDAVLLWLWRRADAGTVTEQGNSAVAVKLREFLRIATQ